MANRPSLARSLVGLVVARRRRQPAAACLPGDARQWVAARGGMLPAQAFSRNVARSASIRARTAVGQARLACQRRVGVDQRGRLLPGLADQVLVVQQPQQLQAGLAASLGGAEHVALPALLQVDPGQREPVKRAGHRVQPLAGRALPPAPR